MSSEELNNRAMFGARLREAIKRRNMASTRVEEEAGLTRGHLSRIFTGEKSLELRTLLAVLDVIDVSPEWLFTGRGPFRRQVVAQLPDEPTVVRT